MDSPSATISSDPSLTSAWAHLRQRGRTALIPYLTAGYPDIDSSLAVLRAAGAFADVIEVGVPFSDPLADGPTIQRSLHTALENGVTLGRTLDLIDRARLHQPVVVFSYLNPILRYGITSFLRDAASIGVAGLLLTDLPVGADPSLEGEIRASALDLIRLIAPTTSDDRLQRTVEAASGFLYLVARLGVTGATAAVDSGLATSINRVRAVTTLPVAVGFGISSPEQAAFVGGLADGVVVGSALVGRLGEGGVDAAVEMMRGLRAALDTADAAR